MKPDSMRTRVREGPLDLIRSARALTTLKVKARQFDRRREPATRMRTGVKRATPRQTAAQAEPAATGCRMGRGARNRGRKACRSAPS